MKNKCLFLIVVLISVIFLSSCGSSLAEKKVESVLINQNKVYSEKFLLQIISECSDPEQAELILDYVSFAYVSDTASVFEWAAYKKWKELMEIKIAKITDPAQAHLIYVNTYRGAVSHMAHQKWLELMAIKIAKINNRKEVYNMYNNSPYFEVRKMAYNKWKALGTKDSY